MSQPNGVRIEHNHMRKFTQKFATITFRKTVCLRRSSEVEISGTRSWTFANKCFSTLTLTLSCASKLVLMSSEFSVYATYPVNCPKWTRNHKCSVCPNSKKKLNPWMGQCELLWIRLYKITSEAFHENQLNCTSGQQST